MLNFHLDKTTINQGKWKGLEAETRSSEKVVINCVEVSKKVKEQNGQDIIYIMDRKNHIFMLGDRDISFLLQELPQSKTYS